MRFLEVETALVKLLNLTYAAKIILLDKLHYHDPVNQLEIRIELSQKQNNYNDGKIKFIYIATCRTIINLQEFSKTPIDVSTCVHFVHFD